MAFTQTGVTNTNAASVDCNSFSGPAIAAKATHNFGHLLVPFVAELTPHFRTLGNNLGPKGIECLSSVLQKNTSLTSLDINGVFMYTHA